MAINFYLTVAGLAAATTAGSNNVALGITHICFGAGQYTPATDGSGYATQTNMVARREKTTLGNGTKPTLTQLTLAGLFPPYTAGAAYNAGELGIYVGDPDAGGILLGIYSAPGYIHAYRNDQLELAESWALTLGPALGAVTVIVDPTAAGAAYMRKDANLGDVLSKPAARTNLDVYSKTESDNFFTSPMEVDNAISAAINLARNISGNGHFKFPSETGENLVIQWGTANSTSTSSQTFPFNVSFVTECFGVVLQEIGNDRQERLWLSPSPTNLAFQIDRDTGVGGSFPFFWIALGK